MKIRLPWTPRVHRPRWAEARSLTDLGRLTAAWLEGEIAHHPGYPGGGPDPETTPLVPVLAHLNRLGFVTANSQPGHAPTVGWDGATYVQRAAVDGWTDDPEIRTALIRLARDRDFHIVIHDPGARTDRMRVPATVRNGDPVTWFGNPYRPEDINHAWPGTAPAARSALTRASHITLTDTTWGPSSRLWDALRNALDDTEANWLHGTRSR
ncbi:DUF6919 domain-containing protein [Streptomyces uncialis]|uniref:DUF6919 domain-containing protein n=1 Tax=Streptomyces uncialis TaxID=1048205 RepID=UPI002F949928|nr:hypothetical protein OG924_37110 [Streptomyces uncialis]